MKKILVFTWVIAIFFTFSCNDNRIYDEHQSVFDNYRWPKSQKVKFKPVINDTVQKYHIYLSFRHVYGFQQKFVALQVETINPSGIKRLKPLTLHVFNANNEYNSDCAGDYCDLEIVIDKDFVFEEMGTYEYIITQQSEIDPMLNVMDVGLIIEKLPNK